MKKLFFAVMPLLMVSLLANCGNKKLDRWYNYEDWWNYCSNGNPTSEATNEDVGREVNLTVNGLIHKVRLIDIDKDVDKNGKTIHCTFEFANLISDSDGYSIATQWNDTDDTTGTANHNYLDSSVRVALVGERQDKGHILWAQYSDQATTTWSSTYASKTVLNMIEDFNPGFTNILVAPKKTVQCNENGTWTDKPIINDKGEYDKLFLLSPEEMGSEESTREGAYNYYQEEDDTKLQSLRIKKQLNGEEVLTDNSKIPSGSAGQEYQDNVNSYAGFNSKVDKTGGGYFWLRSPYTNFNHYAWNVYDVGNFHTNYVYSCAFAVAPAFCI